MKKIILCFILFLVLISSISAVKPVPVIQTNLNTQNALDLRIGIFDPLKINENHSFNVHIFNGLNGLGLNDDRTTVNCTFHLYNHDGNHLVTEWSETFDHVWDIEFPVDGRNFSEIGQYAVIIQCECNSCGTDQANLGGFMSQTFQVTETGFIYDDMKSILFIIALIGVASISLFVTFVIDKEHIYLKVLLLFFVFWILFMIGAFISNPYNFTIHYTFFKLVVSIVSTFVLYVFIYFIYSMFKYFETIPKIKGWKK